MRRMKPHLISPTDRNELSRLVIDAIDTVGIHRIVTKLSTLSPRAIYEVESLVGCLPHVFARRQRWSWFRPATNRVIEVDPVHAPVLMFNRSGYVREAALKAVNQLPDTPFFLAALVRRLNDWVEPVRRAAEESAKRELPRLSTRTVVGTAPFLLERMAHWADGVRHRRSCLTHWLARTACMNSWSNSRRPLRCRRAYCAARCDLDCLTIICCRCFAQRNVPSSVQSRSKQCSTAR
jgi:hypothetical protein